MTGLLKHLPWVYLLIVNLVELFVMYLDKQRAKRKKWRIPEFDLLFIGLIGGGIGGLFAQQLFHHKTRKLRFYFFFIFGTLVAIAIICFSYKR
ncbi:hypothetical protein IGL98_002220 [Enterococcus sp. DIV0840]|uniref:DUF1294 domain-containing protein n=1 Tax=Enterococcus ureasiticus TaxID=903984 RepID=A0A1E5GDQ1_9ENTE|nr:MULTISPECIES: DUF1294 domain-containing protein [Enterococcus]MBO0433356.1 DUF1294 domain-containing protein [Enterococcus sp. DIV0849a]MBO0473517.1 DUF1294 domain-containing protein [Enterococcus ureasiticus]OEG10856.1 hypothetical protein BCR21_11225 [Enterococcus ureasiticus]